ncbi:hypothetical protein HYH70_15930 [Clostridium botulinum]|uniref:exodeoxyribonuclease X C-terminal domain-containing protein n=1 Tax=Clostridium botulinum TaxID=1491 RepID=UPI00035BA926|nr:hypothetical protein [Clostridium botulinum]EPS48176.1 hypothetical protein CFSAN002367_21312 [Clostridium botulinum CFSAN002367]KON10059.1 hypothetical protein ACP52_07915 [Clostridium botulinum]MBY6907070.1 hypothetical protein [Clostridium botulinum]MBY6928584.1 hypothetical protein [Clostridium botulinum]MBY6956179.1 hypothetical protein [Clostridium botulinum]
MENQLEIVKNNQVTSLIDSVDIGTIQGTMQKIATFQAVIQKNLKDGHDFGVVAGAGSKPILLKPGGEKICMMFGLNPEYEFLERTEDYKDGFFAYNIKCTLYRNGNPVSQGVGNCNSMEKKYRYINVDTVPDGIDPSTVEKITTRYGTIKYKIPNPHIADLVNTILKMAKKRAFIDAVLQVASLSDVFTQDLEEMQEFLQQEHVQNIDENSAGNIKINFGKNKGKTLGEIMRETPDYIDWLMKNAKDQVIQKACKILVDKGLSKKEDTPETKEEDLPLFLQDQEV